jgi:hypothetical protein
MMLGDITGTNPVCLASVRTRRPTLGVLYSITKNLKCCARLQNLFGCTICVGLPKNIFDVLTLYLTAARRPTVFDCLDRMTLSNDPAQRFALFQLR